MSIHESFHSCIFGQNNQKYLSSGIKKNNLLPEREFFTLKINNMKTIYLILALVSFSVCVKAQENRLSVSGGYSFAKIEDTEIKTTGWRINGEYAFNPSQGPWAFGIAVGYIGLSASSESILGNTDFTIGTIPIYFAPKFMFGSDKIKGFIKGALGTQNSHLKRTGLLEVTDTDWGFYGGGSAGINFSVSENVFLNAEYELAWLSNTSYRDGLINSAMVGIGIKF
jgi:hypothetical protein